MESHFEMNSLLDDNQHVYRRFHSCETELIIVFDVVYTAMDCGNITILVLMNMSAAFDTVNHQLLLQ
jgi:hypothetical protein